MGKGILVGAGGSSSSKQDKLVGTQGQFVGFDENGNAVAQEVPSTTPTETSGADLPIIVLDGSTMKISDKTIKDLQPSTLRGPHIITTSETFDLSVLGVGIGDTINVICIGGGGGGGGSSSPNYSGSSAGSNVGYGSGGNGGGVSFTDSNRGGGGGGAGYISEKSIIVDALQVPVTIGAGGSGGAGVNRQGTAGGNGGTTSFGSYVSAEGGKGGGGGKAATGASGGAGSNSGGAGSASGGSGAVGHINDGTFSVAIATAGIKSGSGCVMIWY